MIVAFIAVCGVLTGAWLGYLIGVEVANRRKTGGERK